MKRYLNGFVLFLWLALSVSTGTMGWIIIENYSNYISASPPYKTLLKQFSRRSASEMPVERSRFTIDDIEFKNEADLLSYTEERERLSKSYKDAPSKPSEFIIDGIEFKNKKDMLAYVEEKKGISKTANNTSASPANFVIDGIEFKRKEDLIAYAETKRKTERRKLFTFEFILNWVITGGTSQRILITVLTAFSFGVIGCIIDIFKKLIYDSEKLENVKIFLRPLFSGLIAFMILGIAELIPVIFQANTAANVVRPISLFFFCMFGGIMADNVFNWAKNLIADMLNINLEA